MFRRPPSLIRGKMKQQLVVQDVFRVSENTPVTYLRESFCSKLNLRGFPNFGCPVTYERKIVFI